ncbi:hypothetical protein PybrP1_004864 [[Pythium] brassicae (nom. inval.)]|nr:hypothetical protein PybrP1_004864 [[Pythium] brassicae (nom. inval.)]
MTSSSRVQRHTAKVRILAAERDDRKWRSIAQAHEINIGTAANWVSAARASGVWEPEKSGRGGLSYRCVQDRHLARIEALV